MTMKETFLNKKGQFAKITFKRSMKVAAAHKLHTVEKVVWGMLVRCGIDYDNMKSVQDKREDGTLPVENQGLPWGEWEVFPHLIKHKGETYFRFSVAKNVNNQTMVVKYLVDGQEATIDQAKELCIASEFKPKETSLDVFTVKESNLISVE